MARIPSVPRDMPVHHQQFFTAIKKILETLAPPELPPSRPGNLTVKPLPGGNEITFTGGDDADSHILLISDQPTWDPTKANNHIIDLGLSTLHNHHIGIAGVRRYYWVVAQRGTIKADPPTGPESAVTLGLNTGAGVSKFVPLAPGIVRSVQTGKSTVLTTKRGGTRNIL